MITGRDGAGSSFPRGVFDDSPIPFGGISFSCGSIFMVFDVSEAASDAGRDDSAGVEKP